MKQTVEEAAYQNEQIMLLNADIKETEEEASYYEGLRDGVLETTQKSFIAGVSWSNTNPKNSWISVEESLPPDLHKNVLLKIRNSGVFIGLGLNIKDKSFDITHWMPIPKID